MRAVAVAGQHLVNFGGEAAAIIRHQTFDQRTADQCGAGLADQSLEGTVAVDDDTVGIGDGDGHRRRVEQRAEALIGDTPWCGPGVAAHAVADHERTRAGDAGVVIGGLQHKGRDLLAAAGAEMHLALPFAVGLGTGAAGENLVQFPAGEVLGVVAQPAGEALVDEMEGAVDVDRIDARRQEIKEIREFLALVVEDVVDGAVGGDVLGGPQHQAIRRSSERPHRDVDTIPARRQARRPTSGTSAVAARRVPAAWSRRATSSPSKSRTALRHELEAAARQPRAALRPATCAWRLLVRHAIDLRR